MKIFKQKSFTKISIREILQEAFTRIDIRLQTEGDVSGARHAILDRALAQRHGHGIGEIRVLPQDLTEIHRDDCRVSITPEYGTSGSRIVAAVESAPWCLAQRSRERQ